MESLPTVMKVILNIVFYVIYVLIVSILFGFIAPGVFDFMIEAWSRTADMIQVIIAIAVLLATFLFRNFFYISLRNTKK